MTETELADYVDKLHSSTNNPRELGRLLTGAQRKQKKTKTSGRSASEKAVLEDLLKNL